MKIKKLIFIIMLLISVLIVPNTVKAVDATETTITSENDTVEWSYEIVDGVITELKAINTDKSSIKGVLTVPSKIDGYTVTTIGNSAFWGYNSLTKIVLPETITQIDMMAFYECTGLITVELPESLETIGQMAFYGCTALKEITIPAKVSNLESATFYLCTNLEKLTVLSSDLTSNSQPFLNCNNLTIYAYPASGIISFVGTTTDNDIKFAPIYKVDKTELINILAKDEIIDDASGTMVDYEVTLEADLGYKLPENISVYIGGQETTYFMYDKMTGKLRISWGYIDGDIKIVAEAKEEYNINFDISSANISLISVNDTIIGQDTIQVEPGTEMNFVITAFDENILESITYNGEEVLPEKNMQSYSFSRISNSNATIKVVTRELAKYNLIYEIYRNGSLDFAQESCVQGLSNEEIAIELEAGETLSSVTKVIEYKDGTKKEEQLNNNTDFVIEFENDYNIKNIKLIAKINYLHIEIASVEELYNALGGKEFVKLDGNVLTLLKNVELFGKTLVLTDGQYTLDLNGKEIIDQNAGDLSSIIEIRGETKLTIKDSSNEKGKIYSSNLSDYAIIILDDAHLTIDGGRFEGFWGGILVEGQANVIINNGEFYGSEGSGIEIFGNPNVTIKGGEFVGDTYAGILVLYEWISGNVFTPTVKISGGTFNGQYALVTETYTEYNDSVKVTDLLENGYEFSSTDKVNIETINDPDLNEFWISYTDTSNVNVKKVTFKVVLDANTGNFEENKSNFTIDEWKIGDEENLPKPTKEGYEFVGYFTEKTGGTSLEKYIAEAGIDADLTFYAQWKEIKDDSNDNSDNNGEGENTGSTPEGSGSGESMPEDNENTGSTPGDNETADGVGDSSEDDSNSENTENNKNDDEIINSGNTNNSTNSNNTNNSNLKNPQTGDNIELFIAIILVSIIGIVITTKLKKYSK